MAAFLLAAIAPAAGVVVWFDAAAITQEKATVRDKHMILARQLAASAEIMARERLEALGRYAWRGPASPDDRALLEAAVGLGIRYFGLVDMASGRVAHAFEAGGAHSLNPELARALASVARDAPQILPARPDASGRPTLFAVEAAADGFAAIAALDPGFLADLANSVRFGEQGHAVIVDQLGQVLAHPRADWRAEMRDLRGVAPIAALLEGRSGVIEFHSPAADVDMVAGFAVSQALGWGAMVVQPTAELRVASVGGFFSSSLMIVGSLTLLFAIGVGWLTAWLIARPIERVAEAAGRFEVGDATARAPAPTRWGTFETVALGRRFNVMADAVGAHEASLRASLAQADAAERAKSAFLANMSHELRTPLNAVIGFSEVMATELLGPLRNKKYLEYAHDISHSARHLLAMINDVLDLSPAAADRAALEVGPVDVARLLEAAARQIAPQIEGRGLSLRVDDPPTDVAFVADEGRLHQILTKLLQNAAKFTLEGGEVRLSVGVVGESMRFIVADTGVGMTEAEATRALAPFEQPHKAAGSTAQGCGLGLPLAQRLARLHGGDLAIETAPGAGCRVLVDIPLHCSGLAAHAD